MDGNTFVSSGAYAVLENGGPAGSWSGTGAPNSAFHFGWYLDSVTVLDNQASAFFRLVNTGTAAAGGGTIGSTGANRVDNFTVWADVAPVPDAGSSLWLSFAAIAVLLLAGARPALPREE